MATISSNDIVMATASIRGTQVTSFTSTGFSSVSDVLRAVLCNIGTAIGMVDIDLRNSTRGWRERRSLFVPKTPDGIQLSLF